MNIPRNDPATGGGGMKSYPSTDEMMAGSPPEPETQGQGENMITDSIKNLAAFASSLEQSKPEAGAAIKQALAALIQAVQGAIGGGSPAEGPAMGQAPEAPPEDESAPYGTEGNNTKVFQ